jgi:hypothetical protein
MSSHTNNNTIEHAPTMRVTQGPKHYFFGYFDKCPWNASQTKLLAHQVEFNHRPPRPDDIAVIGVIHLDDANRFEPIGETQAWNFQQGAMLQWVGRDADRLIMYNERHGDQFGSVVVDIVSGEKHHYPRPVAALSRDGQMALSLNFARLADTRPGYGYEGIPDPWRDVACPEDDGIYRMDLNTEEVQKILSIAEIVSAADGVQVQGAKHWVNHLLFTPDGTRFCFFHRWATPEGGISTRFMTANVDGTNLFCLTASGMISHFDWRDSQHILAWARKQQPSSSATVDKKKLVKLAKHPIFGIPPFSWLLNAARQYGAVGWVRQNIVGDRFILFTDQTLEAVDVGINVLREDGHCSYSPREELVLMDTYPHEDHRRGLFIYDPKTNRKLELGQFYSMPDVNGEIRCDLHACWSRDGQQVCFDSTHEGSRQIYVMDVSQILAG